MVPQKLRVAARGSPLARIQVEEAIGKLRRVLTSSEWDQIILSSPGDRDLKTPLADPSIPDDYFTRDVDRALLDNRADLAIHSAKDLPEKLHPELEVAALLPARDIRDALVFRKGQAEEPSPNVIGTSSPRRSEEIRKLYPGAELRPIRGTIEGRLEQLDRGDYDAVIIAACALERLGLADRIGQYLPYEPSPQQGRLAIVTRKSDRELARVIGQLDVRSKAGLVALVGCPANSALLSPRARQYMEQADIIYHDRLIPDDILLAIRDRAVAVGKAGGYSNIDQADIHRLMLQEAESGKLVVRLHGGDPCIFGHLAEELDFLTAWNIRVDVIPAPSAAQLASAHALTPLTHRGQGGFITFISGHTDKDNTPPELPGPSGGNLAIYMGVSAIEPNRLALLKAGWPEETPILIGQNLGGRDEQLLHTQLGAIPSDVEIERPAVILVGCRTFPFTGFTLFVGTDPEHFLKYGPILHWPLIKLVSRPVEERAAHLQRRLDEVDGVLFPSRFAVSSFMEALMHGSDVRALAGKKILAVGPTTARELAKYGLNADGAVPSYSGVRELGRVIGPELKGLYLYPCSDAAPREKRIALLQKEGVEVQPEVFYSNRKIAYSLYPRMPVSRVLFSSTSAARYYFELYPDELKTDRTWLAVGPSTLEALQALGLEAEIIQS